MGTSGIKNYKHLQIERVNPSPGNSDLEAETICFPIMCLICSKNKLIFRH